MAEDRIPYSWKDSDVRLVTSWSMEILGVLTEVTSEGVTVSHYQPPDGRPVQNFFPWSSIYRVAKEDEEEGRGC